MAFKYIVALGCSAGCLEPLKRFFDHTPLDSAAYFVLQYLPYDYQSVLYTILRKYSDLRIVVPKDGDLVIENRIYTMPAKCHLMVQEGRIYCYPRDEESKRNYAFDIFLKSLAQEKLGNVIAVVLSGGGTDGVEGIINIKKNGGTVIVQDPVNAEYPSMPLNAIDTNLVDYVLEPARMPMVISKVIHPHKGE